MARERRKKDGLSTEYLASVLLVTNSEKDYHMFKLLKSFRKNESGATMVEYGLMVAVIAMVVVVGGVALGISIDDTFDDATACADAPNTGTCVLN